MAIGSIGNAAPARVGQLAQVEQQAPVQRANVGRAAQGGPAFAFLQRLRSPAEVRMAEFACKVTAAIVRVGKPAIDAVRTSFNKLKEVRQAHAERIANEQRIESQAAMAKEVLSKSTMSLTNPKTGKAFEWPGVMFEDMISALPKDQRMDAVKDLNQTLQNRINNGSQIYAALTGAAHGNMPAADVQNVADFTLFMYATATSQGDFFVNGAFNIADPNGNIATWMDSSAEVYPRGSSHLEGIQSAMITEADGSQHKNVQRGIDIPKTPATGLPANLKTVCYGTITPLPGSTGARRLFLKAESFGCRINNLSSKSPEELNAGVTARPKRGMTDVKQALGHGGSFIVTRFQKNIGGSRKEHFPSSITNIFNKWSGNTWYHKLTGNRFNKIKLPPETSEAGQLFSKILKGNCKTGGFGLRQLSTKLAEVEDYLRSPQGNQIPPDQCNQIANFLAEIKIAIAQLPNNDRLDVRLGNEVLID